MPWMRSNALLLLLFVLVVTIVLFLGPMASSGISTGGDPEATEVSASKLPTALPHQVETLASPPTQTMQPAHSAEFHQRVAAQGGPPITIPMLDPILAKRNSLLVDSRTFHANTLDDVLANNATEDYATVPLPRGLVVSPHRSALSPAEGRFLGTEKLWAKYGLTNVLMTLAAMFAYAATDNRTVVLPKDSPVVLTQLLDIPETQRLLLPAAVVIVQNESLEAALPTGQKARRLKESLGNRKESRTLSRRDGEFAFIRHLGRMNRTSHIQYLIHRDFFLRFPFRHTAPLDMCFYIRRMIFHASIRRKAHTVLSWLRSKGVSRLMALHLRLEFDVKLLVKSAAAISADELKRFLAEEVMPVARAAAIDGIYVCAGGLKAQYVEVLRALPLPVYLKGDVPELEAEGDGPRTTSHLSAAMDVTIMQHATVTIGFSGSTILLSVLSKRCPSPVSADPAAFKRFFASPLLSVKPGLHEESVPARAVRRSAADDAFGVLGYDFNEGARTAAFSKLHFIPCTHPFQFQCFYP